MDKTNADEVHRKHVFHSADVCSANSALVMPKRDKKISLRLQSLSGGIESLSQEIIQIDQEIEGNLGAYPN